MSAKCLAVMIVLVGFAASGWAQINDVSVTVGRTFISTQTVPSTNLPLHFGDNATVAFNYGRFILRRHIFGLTAELPVAIVPHTGLNYYLGTVPKNFGSFFIAPSARLNIFAGESVSPWVSLGGGYGHFSPNSTLLYGGPNPGSSTNTGVLQFGAGLDVWIWSRWGARMEARDFYSGIPDYNVDTGRSRQHNYYVGVGVIHRF